MKPPDPETITRLLEDVAAGDARATDELLPVVYDELRRLASAYLAAERPGHTLQPTALANEAYLKLVGRSDVWNGRGHFFRVAAKAMRNLLVDHARGRGRQKRGGDWRRADVHSGIASPDRDVDPLDVIALDEALAQLEELDPRKARLVELRFFAGLTSEQAADVLGISRSLAATEWRVARAWLYRELSEETDGEP